MTQARFSLAGILSFSLLVFLVACGDSGNADAGMDASVDTGTPDTGTPDAGGVDSGLTTLPGLHMPVRVVRDTRGMLHIYATDLHDAAYANGYLQAQDRFPQ